MKSLFVKGTNNRLFVVFHGTGGNETSLYPILELLDGKANVMSYLGDVGRGVNRRFFAPLIDGALDKEDFDKRVANWLQKWEQFDRSPFNEIVFIGYSNGANFIQGLLQAQPEIADRVIFLHPSNFDLEWAEGNETTKILLTIGSQDTLVIPGRSYQLGMALEKIYPLTTTKLLDGHHGVSDQEIEYVAHWLKSM